MCWRICANFITLLSLPKDGKVCQKKKKSKKLEGFYIKRRFHFAKYGFFLFVTKLIKDYRKIIFPSQAKK